MFVVKKKISLDFLGEGWAEASLTFSPFTYRDNEKLLMMRKLVSSESPEDAVKSSKEMMDLLRDKFIEGTGFDGEKLIGVTKEDFPDLPIEVIVQCLQQLQGQVVGLPLKG